MILNIILIITIRICNNHNHQSNDPPTVSNNDNNIND